MNNPETEVARVERSDLVRHGKQWILGVQFKYSGGGDQGLGYLIDLDFVGRFMDVFEIESLSEAKGRYCLVTHNHDGIQKIAPVFHEDGTAFDIADWKSERSKDA